MRRQEKALNAPSNVSNAWFGPLTIRDRFWRFLGINRAAPKSASVKPTLEYLEIIALPNNLTASGLVPDLAPADTTLTTPATDLTFGASTDTATMLSGFASAAPLAPADGQPRTLSFP
jgi:hypothetical protein